MKWYMPSWNGDLRLEETKDNRVELSIVRPTPHEIQVLKALGATLLQEKIIEKWDASLGRLRLSKKIMIPAPMTKVGPIIARLLRPGEAVVTAVRFKSGRVITCTGTGSELSAFAEELLAQGNDRPYQTPPSPKPEAPIEETKPEPPKPEPPKAEEPKKEDKPAAAATAKRPTPSCPQCLPGAVTPASEVLLEFLTPEQHETWARDRYVMAIGGFSGHRYAIAHRHSPLGMRQGRIARDLDTGVVLHFHDWSVPPEEEVLATKIILEHHEDWLRNEATYFHGNPGDRFKNPFGGGGDGVVDSQLTARVGFEGFAAIRKLLS